MGKRGKIIGSLSTAASVLAAMHVFNLTYNYYACRKHLLPKAPENLFLWKGINVYYEKHGEGSPLILLHSLHPAVCSYEWHEIVDKLAEQHTVYLIDLPGCGRSAKPGVLYTNFYYVNLLKDFIKENGIEKPAVVASNSSSSIALMLAAYEKDFISRIIMINPKSPSELALNPDFKSRLIYHILKPPFIGTFIYSVISCRAQVDHTMIEKYFYNPFHDTDELVDTYCESAHLKGGRGHFFAASLYGNFINANISAALKKMDLPIKLIEGKSTDSSENDVNEWTAMNPNIETAFIEHSRNLPMLEEPEKTAEEILSFTA